MGVGVLGVSRNNVSWFRRCLDGLFRWTRVNLVQDISNTELGRMGMGMAGGLLAWMWMGMR